MLEELREGQEAMLSRIKESEGSYSTLQLYFLKRLGRLLHLRSEQSGQLNDEGTHLIDRAIYSTYCDAVDLGVSTEAQKVLHRAVAPSAKLAQ